MRKATVIAFAALVLVISGAPIAHAGEDSGACVAILAEGGPPDGVNGEAAYVCTDELNFDECAQFCGVEGLEGGGPELILVDCEWVENATCEDLTSKIGEPWEGACVFNEQIPPPIGGICTLIAEELPNWTAEEICDFGKIGGTWLGDGSTCAAPVPTLPKAGQAALVLVLMLGALVVLNMSGMLRSG